MPHAAKRAVRRPAFTLIEMLVVLAIIAILASLTAAAVFRMIGTTQAKDTKAELTKLNTLLQGDWSAAAHKYATEPIPNQGSAMGNVYYNTVLPMAGGDRGRAMVIWTKLRLKQTFPMTFAEALNPAPMPALSTYQDALGLLGYNTANTTVPQPWESSVLLRMALERGIEGNGIKMEDLGVSSCLHDFPPAPARTPNGQTVKGLVDGWGKPIYFIRWPVYLSASNYGLTGLPVPNPPGPAFNDPTDPTGLLASAAWQTSPAPTGFPQTPYQWFTTTIHGLAPHTTANTEPTTYRIFPVIASGGQNNRMGYDNGLPAGTNPSPGFNPNIVQTQPGSIDADDLLGTLNQ